MATDDVRSDAAASSAAEVAYKDAIRAEEKEWQILRDMPVSTLGEMLAQNERAAAASATMREKRKAYVGF